MPVPKFSFVPERLIGVQSDPTYRVSILKSGMLLFRKDDIKIYDLANKYVRFFADVEKKAIGWSVCEGKTALENLNDARVVNPNKVGCALFGITKLLKHLGFEKGVVFKDLEVKLYKSPLIENDVWYVKLEKNEG